jgi:glyoxylase-like metal-dependent hydrolase (beta-lactamase superfamily II)
MMQMASDTCRLTPLDVGLCMLGEGHALGDSYSDENRIPFAIYSFAIQSAFGRNALVDLGPKTLQYCNEMFRRYNLFRTSPDGDHPDDIAQRCGNLLDQLPHLGLTPADISDVIFSHLHADHHGMDDAKDGGMCEDFPNARFHVSRKGWEYNLERRVDGHWNSYLDWGFGDFLLRMEKAGRAVFADDCEIAPGVSTIYLGGHSPCSQAVRVETSHGPAVVTSDDVYRYGLLEHGIMARISTTPEKLLEATDLLARMALDEGAMLIPVHDPVLVELHSRSGDGWLSEAAELSRKAAEGYVRIRSSR